VGTNIRDGRGARWIVTAAQRIAVRKRGSIGNDLFTPSKRVRGEQIMELLDPASGSAADFRLPSPRLTPVYRLVATLGPPLDLGDTAAGHRRIVPLTGGTFTGPALSGTLLPGVSADWQTVLPDGTALGDIRYALRTDAGALLYVQSRSVRHGSAEVLARLGRGEDVDPSEYTFRTSTQIEAAAPQLDWLNKGVFVSVAGRLASGVIYETYLVA
jgi:Protein of unknown function (DUF3237)